MTINHFSCARLTTHLTLLIFILFTLGVIFWISDEFLDWNILPNWIDSYAQLIIVIVGIFAFLLVASTLLCSLMVFVELAAQKIGLQKTEFRWVTRQRVVIFTITMVIVLITFFTLHKIDEYREESRLAKNRAKFQEKLLQFSKELEQSLPHIVTLFPENIIQAIENKTFMEKPIHRELTKLLTAISASLPNEPDIFLLMPANHPYQYRQIWVTHGYQEFNQWNHQESNQPTPANSPEHEEYGFNGHRIRQQFFTQLPNKLEHQLVEALFKENQQTLKKPMKGNIIDNTNPSTWGLLKLNDKVVALIYLESSVMEYDYDNERVSKGIFHTGPTKLITNLDKF